MMTILNRIVGYFLGFTGLGLFIVAICLGKAFSAIRAYINKQCERVVAAVCGF